MSQFIPRIVGKLFGAAPRHALGFGAVLTVAVIAARIKTEREKAAKEAAEYGRHAAPVEPVPFADPDTIIAAAVPIPFVPEMFGENRPPADPDPTLPLSRAELAEVIEVSGGRPLHDLDHVQRVCPHTHGNHRRCADCGVTWASPLDAMGGAR